MVNQISATQSVSLLKGVGPRVEEKLQRLGIVTLGDVLFHLPLRYEDRTRVVPIGSLQPGEAAVVQGEIQLTDIKYARRRMLLSRISDGTGSILLRFFHFSVAQQSSLARGKHIRCYGEVRKGPAGLELVHPEYRLTDEVEEEVEEHLTAIYSTTEGVHQLSIRQFVSQVLDLLENKRLLLTELLPASIRKKLDLPSLSESLLLLHRPNPDISLSALTEGQHPAQQRLAFEELLANQLSLQRLRKRNAQHKAPKLSTRGELASRFLSILQFQLTNAQNNVVAEIENDLHKTTPMQRLVQGDVGSGKTVVAAIASLYAIENNYQAAFMAPTELLAEQHYQNFSSWLNPLGIKVAFLSSRLKDQERKTVLGKLKTGETAVAVGTHALFQDDVFFAALGLVIIDEQHRFGVHQRLALREKGAENGFYPHQLIMTATPIPRTLAQTAYADLDYSVIDELPPGRSPVETVVVSDARRDEVVARMHQACKQGRQAYWVCTLIEESEVLECQAAEDTATNLSNALPDLSVGLVHGRMKPTDKEKIMAAFKEGRIDVLVATTVIEVGVDVANASLMVIENPERLGLAQLHQLRGRVGRGTTASSCVLLYHGRLNETARERLAALRETNDGFEIAKRDLEIRGPGELLGTRQSGLMRLRIADLQRDIHLLPQVHKVAAEMLKTDPQCVEDLIQRWLGNGFQYREA